MCSEGWLLLQHSPHRRQLGVAGVAKGLPAVWPGRPFCLVFIREVCTLFCPFAITYFSRLVCFSIGLLGIAVCLFDLFFSSPSCPLVPFIGRMFSLVRSSVLT